MKSILILRKLLKNFFKFADFRKKLSKFFYASLVGILIIIPSVLIFTAQPADGIDEIQIIYESINITITISDLEKFADTGEQSEQLKSLFLTTNASQKNIDTIQAILIYKLQVKPDLLNKLLESRYGQLAIDEFSRHFFPDSNISKITDNILDTINNIIADGEVSFLELIQNFKWTDKIVVDAKGIETFLVETIEFAKRGIDFVREQPSLQKIFCG
ncbi:MAG: alpha/beta hydrolase [Trichodesmium sp. St16_bin4-tuft]|nr:alpha/beta hydrolase [Trichodesmium sp. St4_bin8_1]MDE5072603.1 alpha/beta hydrolase [Trichodesmium sp. St5_bin8]MDE5077008.1 alpha/beta hydrolase [Trichodesmium sp. St2_bin6]MDE5100706.1 alpha/beta hydrolase [Trichodesmium sp. St16_bin4-tuft]MDE5103246.1 alpha/beta hydrolase [Trichodesmium sp. St19_bin2]